MTAEFRIGSTDAEHLFVAVLGRASADDENFWDRNWVITTICVAVGGFVGRVRALLRTEEIHSFNEGLKVLNQNLSGSAVLDSMEDWISVTVAAGSGGQIYVTGQLKDAAGGGGRGNILAFELPEVDQTYLAGWISALDDIEKAFPVIESP